MEEIFRSYWDDALSIVSRQCASATEACESLSRKLDSSRPNLQQVVRELRPSANPKVGEADVKEANEGHLIRPDDPRFRRSLSWLQSELARLIEPLEGAGRDRNEAMRVLEFTPEETLSHFGTLTEGWDKLVQLKQRLLLPDRIESERSAWFVSLMADFERSIREIICLTVQHLGRVEPVRQAIIRTAAAMNISDPTPTSLLRWARSEDAQADAFSSFMIRSLDNTVQVAEQLRTELKVQTIEFHHEKEFSRHLGDLGADITTIIRTLVDTQSILLHDASLIDKSRGPGTEERPSATGLISSPEYAGVIVQFLYGYSIQVALGIMDSISRDVSWIGTSEDMREQVEDARYKAAAELRVGDLGLLSRELWWLAWALAEVVRDFGYEDPTKLMLHFNALYAQSELDITGWQNQVRKTDVRESAVRYKILRKTLLQEWDGIEDLVREAIRTHDMTESEFETWPALRRLREHGILSAVFESIASGIEE